MNKLSKLSVIVLAILGMVSTTWAYEGYVPITTGGDSGTVVHVTNLNDSGTGSLRAVIAGLSDNQKIVFDVGGSICVTTEMRIGRNNITVDGSSAPSPGITLVGSGLYNCLLGIKANDIIVKHMRFRNSGAEGIQIWEGIGIVVDHCSVTGSGDGAVDINTADHVVISRCLFGSNTEVHKAHGTYVSAHHNLYSWNNRRQPRVFEAGPYWDFRNNVVEFWSGTGTNILLSNAVNVVNNWYGNPGPLATCTNGFLGLTSDTNVYTNGNYSACGQNIDAVGNISTPNLEPGVTTTDANTAYNSVLADVGAQPTDAIDQYYIDGGGMTPPAIVCGGSSGGGSLWSETANYYVNGLTGSDTNAGTSSAPWKTLTKAVSTATAGKKVLVWGGQTYTGALTFNNSGTSSSLITFRRDPISGPAIIDGTGTLNGTLYSTKAKYVVVDGFTLTKGKYGVYTNGSIVTNWTIKNCRITGNTMHGIYLRSSKNFSFFNDAVYLNGSASYGIYIFSTATNNNVIRCNVYKHKYGIDYDTSSTGTVTNSIITKNTVYGVYGKSSTVTVIYSDVWDNGTNYSGCAVGSGVGCITADPLFTAPDDGDFSLMPGSPAIGHADDGGDMGYRLGDTAL